MRRNFVLSVRIFISLIWIALSYKAVTYLHQHYGESIITFGDILAVFNVMINTVLIVLGIILLLNKTFFVENSWWDMLLEWMDEQDKDS